jgi:hypothetical protein
MWLQATLSHDDLVQYLDELMPLRISLAKPDETPRVVELGMPRRLELVPGVGVRVETHARIEWPVLGLQVPAHIRSVQVLFKPRIEAHESDPVLAFGLVIEHLDVSLVPGIVEGAIVDVINGELAGEGILPSWAFTRALDFSFDLPPALGEDGEIRLYASWGDVKITDDGITFAVSFRAGVTRVHDADPLEAPDTDDVPPRMEGVPGATGERVAPRHSVASMAGSNR